VRTRDKENTTIAIVGTDTMVGWAILLLLQGEAGRGLRDQDGGSPPPSSLEDLMEGVDLLLIPPDLVHSRCEESLAALRGKRQRIGVPVLSLSSAVKEGLLHEEEVRIVPWPITIGELAREIEGVLYTTHSVE